jgi:hypothetical protein
MKNFKNFEIGQFPCLLEMHRIMPKKFDKLKDLSFGDRVHLVKFMKHREDLLNDADLVALLACFHSTQ